MSHGLIIGKFLPLHKGHLHLIDEAAKRCDTLTVILFSLPTEPIPGSLRFDWLKSHCSRHNLIHSELDLPSYPDQHPDFWNIWRQTLKDLAPGVTHLFSSESYGDQLAEVLNIHHICISPDRNIVPVSARLIRSNPHKYWDYIPHAVRPFFRRRIALLGPESVGKSTLAKQLASHYQTRYIPEYGRTYTDNRQMDPAKSLDFNLDDITNIAIGHHRQEWLNSLFARELLISDTDYLTTAIWSEIYFNAVPDLVREMHHAYPYDFRLLLSPDIDWHQDGTRNFPSSRQSHFERLKSVLDQEHLPYAVITGTGPDRFTNALAAIETARLSWAKQLVNPADQGRPGFGS